VALEETIELVTPGRAALWLQKRTVPTSILVRDEHVLRVARYGELMKSGRWRLERTSNLRFDQYGWIRDGHHRLAACVRVVCAFATYVVRGIWP
jgi:hypothetical protein